MKLNSYRLNGFLCGLIILLLALTTTAKPAFAYDLKSEVVEFKLSNGMLWLLLDRPGVPSFAGIVTVKVGTIDDPKGKIGISHMFEHMAFKGTDEIGTVNFEEEKIILDKINELGRELTFENQKAKPDKDKIKKMEEEFARLQEEHKGYVFSEIDLILDQNGAVGTNAGTGYDNTTYYSQMPGHKLELWAYITSQQLFNTVFREFYKERNVIAEERRLRIDTSPWGIVFEELFKQAFKKSPYGRLSIGTMEDIQSYTAEDAQALHNKYYTPSNMVGAIVGNIDIEETKKILERQFGKYSDRPLEKRTYPQEDKQTKERRATVYFDSEPRVAIAYHKPNLPNYEDYVFDIMYFTLCKGRSSRLYQRLVEKDKLASDVSCATAYPGNLLPNLMLITTMPLNNVKPKLVEDAILDEIDKLRKEPVSDYEIQKALNSTLADSYFAMEQNDILAETLADYQTIIGNWRYIVDKQDIYKKISAGDITEVSNKYLVPENRTVVWQLRKK